MTNQQLGDYISDSRKSGGTEDQIRAELLKSGWNIADINEALIGKPVPPPPPPYSQPSSQPQDIQVVATPGALPRLG